MSDTLPNNPFDDRLPIGLQSVVADLDAKIADENAGWSTHHKDVFRAIRDCILARKPIDKELQEQYVMALANHQAVNRFGQ